MPDPLLYLESMGLAAIVSLLCILAIAAPRCPAGRTRLNIASILAIAAGIVAGHLVTSSRSPWPPFNGLDRWLAIVIPLAIVIELIAGFPRIPASVAWLLRIGLAVTIPRILLHGTIYLSESNDAWPLWQTVLTTAIAGALLAGVWILLDRLTQRTSSGVSISLSIAMATQCAGLAIMLAGYLKGGAAGFPLAATLATATLAVRLFAKPLPPAILSLGIVNLFSLLFIGRFFGRLTTGCAIAILFTPLACWVTEIPLLRHRKPLFTGAFRLALVAIPLLIVLALAKRDFDRSLAPLARDPFPRSRGHFFVRVDLQGTAESNIQSSPALVPSGQSAGTFPDSSIGRASGC